MGRNTRAEYFALGGGLDVVSPALSIPPGRALTLVNYEPFYNGGYRRIDGYERFDGRPRPSEQTYIGAELDDASGYSVGDPIEGDDSGATGEIAAIDGNWIAIVKVTGTFEQETVDGATAEIVNQDPLALLAEDSDMEDAFLLAAQNVYRDDIAVVPGSGSVNGAWRRDATAYAVRNNAGGTAGVLHKASSSGWTTSGITMLPYIYFDAGGGGAATALPAEGTTINGETSGATGVVHRVVLHSGSTAANDAAGYLVLRSVSGTFVDTENLRVTTTKFAEAASGPTTFAFPIGGTYQFVNHNFYGSATTFRTYGVNAVGPAFEIDENDRVSPILFPLTADDDAPAANTPHLIEKHRNHLFLAFPGGRMVHSAPGDPLLLNGFLGAAEFGLGAEITGLNSVAGGVLIVTTARFTQGLFGASTDDWELRLIGEKTGARLFTSQRLDTVYGLDDLGITSVARTDQFGDFQGATVSQLVQPTLAALRNNVTMATVSRSSNQYRVYFDDGSFAIMYQPSPGAVSQTRGTQTAIGVEFGFGIYPIPVSKIYNSEDADGTERTYFCSGTDGFVYEDRIGRNFDGDEIESYFRSAFTHLRSPAMRKFYRRCDLELAAEKPLELKFVHDLSYGSAELSSAVNDITVNNVEVLNVLAGAGFWDTDNWDQFYWDGQSISTARAELNGSSENIGFLVYHTSAISAPHILQGFTVHYDTRRLQR